MQFLFVFSISLIGLFFLFFNTFLFYNNKSVRSKVSKYFLIYLLLLSIIELFCHIIGFLNPNSNFFLSHFYFGFQFVFLSILYLKLIDNSVVKGIIATVCVLQMGYLVYTYYTDNSLFWKFNIYEIISSSILLIIYLGYYLFKNLEIQHKYYNFSIGLFFYLTCSILIFLYGEFELVLCKNPYIDIWIFNSLFYILFQYFIFREYHYFKNKNIDQKK